MTEKLTIQNFAGIKNLEIVLTEINVLIGPQATGKSVCAKLLYFFKNFINNLFTAAEQQLTKRELDKSVLQKFEEYFPRLSLGHSNFTLRYTAGNSFIQVIRVESRLRLDYSKSYTNILNSLKQQFNSAVSTERMVFFDIFHTVLEKQPIYSQWFIPAGRSFFAILQNNIFSFLSSNNAIDPFLASFGSLYESVKRYLAIEKKDDESKQSRKVVDKLVKEILSSQYESEKGKDFLVADDGRRINLANSSSGQQEILPLVLILKFMLFAELSGDGNTVYIEEPEAHLFPATQRKVIELIATIYNLATAPAQFVITTHSPYVLAAFNNLIYAGNLATELDDQRKSALRRIVPETQWLKSSQVNVYSLHDGFAEYIKSDETGLITTSILDSVSDELSNQFDDLLDA